MPGSAATVAAKAALGTATTTRLAVGDRRGLDRRGGDAVQVDVREVARVAAGLRDRRGLLRVAAGERHVVAVVAEHDREAPSPTSRRRR